MGSVAVAGSAHATLDTDLVLITDPGIDFGDNTYLISAPIGWGLWSGISSTATTRRR